MVALIACGGVYVLFDTVVTEFTPLLSLRHETSDISDMWYMILMKYVYRHVYLSTDGAKCSLSWSSLFKEPSFFNRFKKLEWVRIFCKYIRTCWIVTPCLISYSICLQTIEILPYRLFCFFSQFVAFSDNPVTNLITSFSICSICHSVIGKLFCIKKDHLSW